MMVMKMILMAKMVDQVMSMKMVGKMVGKMSNAIVEIGISLVNVGAMVSYLGIVSSFYRAFTSRKSVHIILLYLRINFLTTDFHPLISLLFLYRVSKNMRCD